MTPKDVEVLTKAYLAPRYDQPVAVPAFHREIWRLCCSEHQQVAIAAPRGHAKSTALTFAYALGLVLFGESRHLLILGSNESLAGDFLNDIKVELAENDALIEDFGPFKVFKDQAAEFVCRSPLGKFRIICKGAGQRMRGLKWERKRPDTVLCDDLEDDEIVLNEERRDKLKRWFYGAVRPIVKSGGKIRLYGTILHMDSLLESAMPAKQNRKEEPLKLSAIDPQKEGWYAVKYRAFDPETWEILWPEQFSRAKLERLRQEYAQMGLSDVFSQEYLNDPVDQATAYFRREDLLPMKESDRETRKTYYVGVDFAISESKKRAYTAIVVGGVDENRQLHIVDVRRGRWDTLEIVEEMFAVQERWDPVLWRLEKENIQKALKPVLDHENLKRQTVWIPYDEKAPTKDKLQRARALQYRMRAGNVRF